MGTREKRERQEDLWVVTSEVVGTPAHAFYDRLNQILDQHQPEYGFVRFDRI